MHCQGELQYPFAQPGYLLHLSHSSPSNPLLQIQSFGTLNNLFLFIIKELIKLNVNALFTRFSNFNRSERQTRGTLLPTLEILLLTIEILLLTTGILL